MPLHFSAQALSSVAIAGTNSSERHPDQRQAGQRRQIVASPGKIRASPTTGGVPRLRR
jgi:hypothetical protein